MSVLGHGAHAVIGVGNLRVAGVVEAPARRPVELDRRDGGEERPGKIAGRADASAIRIASSVASSPIASFRSWVSSSHEVDGAGNGGAEMLDRKARDALDAGAARDQRRPVLVEPDAERGDDADAGDRHHRTAAGIPDLRTHDTLLAGHVTGSTSPMPSPRHDAPCIDEDRLRRGGRRRLEAGLVDRPVERLLRQRQRGERHHRRESRLDAGAEHVRASPAPYRSRLRPSIRRASRAPPGSGRGCRWRR